MIIPWEIMNKKVEEQLLKTLGKVYPFTFEVITQTYDVCKTIEITSRMLELYLESGVDSDTLLRTIIPYNKLPKEKINEFTEKN